MSQVFKSVRSWCAVGALGLVAMASSVAQADPVYFHGTIVSSFQEFDFDRISNNYSVNLESNFSLKVFDLTATGQIGFRIVNDGSALGSARVGEVYFYDGHLITNGAFVGPDTTPPIFAKEGANGAGVSPKDLPEFHPAATLSMTKFVYAADAEPSGTGITAGQYADFLFDLKPGISYARILGELTSDQTVPSPVFYIGIHVKSELAPNGSGSDSDAMLADGDPTGNPGGGEGTDAVPLPATTAATVTLLAVLAAKRRRRQPNPA
jgi:hypothetical protein